MVQLKQNRILRQTASLRTSFFCPLPTFTASRVDLAHLKYRVSCKAQSHR